MERLTERTADGILVKENHGENGLRTFYQCFEEKPNDKYTNCDGGYCAIEKSYDTMMMYEVKDLVDDLLDIVKAGGTDGN